MSKKNKILYSFFGLILFISQSGVAMESFALNNLRPKQKLDILMALTSGAGLENDMDFPGFEFDNYNHISPPSINQSSPLVLAEALDQLGINITFSKQGAVFNLIKEGEKFEIGENKLAYMGPKDEEVGNFLQTTNFNSKGIWLIKDGSKWVGFTKDGPLWLTEDEWKSQQKNSLSAECPLVSNIDFNSKCDAGLVSCYIGMGRLDEWIMVSSRGEGLD